MASQQRNINLGSWQHIYNRANFRMNVFLEPEDYYYYLLKLEQIMYETGDRLHAYCIMPNHIHLVVQAFSSESISKTISRSSNSYSRYIGLKYGMVGHLFQGVFGNRDIPTEDNIRTTVRYVERNPLELGYDENTLFRYPWSSFGYRLHPEQEPFPRNLDIKSVLRLHNNNLSKYYRSITNQKIPSQFLRRIDSTNE